MGTEAIEIYGREGFTEVLFIRLSLPSGSSVYALKKEIRRLTERGGFERMNSSMLWYWGIEALDFRGNSNPHAHLIGATHTDALQRFWRRWKMYDLDRQWIGRCKGANNELIHVRPFDHSKKARGYSYVLNKHVAQQPLLVCGKYYERCKRGQCDCFNKINLNSIDNQQH